MPKLDSLSFSPSVQRLEYSHILEGVGRPGARGQLQLNAVGLDLTLRVWVTEEDVQRISALPDHLGETLENQIRAWWAFRDLEKNNPHDPLAALSMIDPTLFRFEYADVNVGRTGREFAKTRLTNFGKGSVRLASDVLALTAEKEIVRRITS